VPTKFSLSNIKLGVNHSFCLFTCLFFLDLNGHTTFECIFNFRCAMFEHKSFLRLRAFYLWFTWGMVEIFRKNRFVRF
jgi:hypothetical protein